MECVKCQKSIPEDALFCQYCGVKQGASVQKAKNRGNGQGSVYQLKNKSYIAVRTLGYYLGDDGKKHRKIVSKCFKRKKDAVEALPLLGREKTAEGKAERKAKTTLKELYDIWIPTHRAGKSALGNYRAAIKYFSALYHVPAADVDVDDLQECIDECPRGKSTRSNMKTVMGLIYKFGIPRGYFPEKLNLAQYLVVGGEAGAGGVGLPSEYLETLKQAAGSSLYASYIVCQCYLGFRPSELLALRVECYDAQERAFVGGAKTDAGRDRTVTVSPKIQPIIDSLIKDRDSGQVFRKANGECLGLEEYRAEFYAVLDELGLDNPIYTINGCQRHTYTPHSCRHTFATLLKRVDGADKDKLSLIGHTNGQQLRYYQDVEYEDLRKITDNL